MSCRQASRVFNKKSSMQASANFLLAQSEIAKTGLSMQGSIELREAQASGIRDIEVADPAVC